jgi:exopolyphosphatase/guanosine-5'-triphosphate,3'-diphosphate pyrophosphatase
MERAISTIKKFKGMADSYNAKIKAVATSAVREAHNKNELIERVYKETGIDIEVISGHEEARLIYLGALKAVPIFNKKSLVLDIGGGSTEFLLGHKENISYSVSLKIGAVRMTQKFFPDFVVTEQRVRDCRKWIQGELYLVAGIVKEKGFEVCVGASGTIMAAGLMIHSMRKLNSLPTILNNFEFTKEELDEVVKKILSKKTAEKRKKLPGIDDKRADIIPAGIIILQTIFELFELKSMIVSGYALREGIVIDSLQKLSTETAKPNLAQIRKGSVLQLAEKCIYDREHCLHISRLALKLYDDLQELHQLEPECRELIQASAILHDVGYHIAHTNHHHHSYYIIKNSELLGSSENEINIIAHTARYHRKSHPKSSHEDYAALQPRIKETVDKLAAILRVADSFDRTHRRIVIDLNARVNGKNVELNLVCNGNIEPEIELWNLNRRKGLFEEVFGKTLKVFY